MEKTFRHDFLFNLYLLEWNSKPIFNLYSSFLTLKMQSRCKIIFSAFAIQMEIIYIISK